MKGKRFFFPWRTEVTLNSVYTRYPESNDLPSNNNTPPNSKSHRPPLCFWKIAVCGFRCGKETAASAKQTLLPTSRLIGNWRTLFCWLHCWKFARANYFQPICFVYWFCFLSVNIQTTTSRLVQFKCGLPVRNKLIFNCFPDYHTQELLMEK